MAENSKEFNRQDTDTGLNHPCEEDEQAVPQAAGLVGRVRENAGA